MDPFIGEIVLLAFNFPPRGYATCDGQIMSISQNTALFSLLGTYYGGDGRTTFALPDLRGRVPISAGFAPGLSGYNIGQSGGQESHTLLPAEVPAHQHSIGAGGVQTTNRPGNGYAAQGGVYAATSTTTMAPTGISGGNQPHNNMQPFLVLNYSIALQGIYPSRN
jgi:microcystin-dependent protein